jgi:hypothetical protein
LGLFVGQRRAVHGPQSNGVCGIGLEEKRFRRQHLRPVRCDLPESAHLIHYPKAPAVGRDIQIVAANDDIANRSDGHVVL